MLKIAGAREIVPRKIASPPENSPPVKLPSRIIARLHYYAKLFFYKQEC